MDVVRLHFAGPTSSPLELPEGSYRIGCHNGGLGLVNDQADAQINIRVDRRCIWLSVCKTTVCVHVNGRRIYQLALLRAGDVIHLDRTELRLTSAPRTLPAQLFASASALDADPRLVLRVIAGPDHGRCFPLDRPRLVGRSSKADLHIDNPDCSERHAWLEWNQGQVLLRHPGASDRSLVNGHALHEAALGVGDQVTFSPRHRVVVEAPYGPAPPADEATAPSPQALTLRRPLWPLFWLLVAAALLAVLLAGVLLFGVA